MRGIFGIVAVMLLLAGIVSAKALYTVAPDPIGGGCGGHHVDPPAPVKPVVKVVPAPVSGGYTNSYVFGLTYMPKQGLCFMSEDLRVLSGMRFPACETGRLGVLGVK